MELKMKTEQTVSAAGSLGVFEVDNENKVRVVIEQAGSSNEIIISAKLRGQSDFVVLKTLIGNSNETVNVSTYEVMKIECSIFDPIAESIKVIASSFNEASGSPLVDAPTGDIISDIEILHFTSSDGSVSIAANNATKTLDFTVDLADFDDVLEFPSLLDFPLLGSSNTIYIAQDTEAVYRWSGSLYIEVSPSPVHSVAGRVGDIVLTKSDVGLSNVDNTADINKPISSATQTALNNKVTKSGDTMTGPLNMSALSDNVQLSVYGLNSTSTIEVRTDDNSLAPTGDVKLTTGDAAGSDYAGSIYLNGGSNVDGNPANIQLTAGQSSGTGANGSIILDSRNVVYLNQNALGSIQASNHRIEYVLDPVENQDAATKIWVEGLSSITNTIIVDASSAIPYPDGSIFKPFSTIAEAIAVSTDNTTIVLLPGLYEETKVLVPSTLKNLVILGQSRDNTTIKNGIEYTSPNDDISILFEKVDVGQFTFNATSALNGIVSIKQSSVICDRLDNNFNVIMSITESNIVGGSIVGGPTNINECLILSSPVISGGLLIVENTKFIQKIEVSGPDLVTIRTLDCELFGASEFILGNSNTIWETDLATDYLGTSSAVTKVLLASVPLSSINQSGAVLGNVPTWNGTTWIPVAPSGGSGGVTDHTLLTSIGVYPHSSIDTHINSISNPHSVTASQVGLGNVDNTSDINKPISSATQDALDLKYDASNPNGYITLAEAPSGLVSSVNGQIGDIVLFKEDIDLANVDNTSDADKPISTLTQNALNLITNVIWTGDYDNGRTYTVGEGVMFNGASFRMIIAIGAAGYAPSAYPSNWLQVSDYVSPNDIGLGNVDNTSDIDKPISTLTQAALDDKFNNPTGTVTDYIAGDGTIQPFPSTSTSSNLITEVYNKSGSLIQKFKAVYINGGQGNLPSIVLSQANTEPTSSKTYGVVQSDISNMSNGFVIAQGRLENLDTAILGGTEGTSLWLSPSIAGDITITKPSAPNHAVYIGTIVRSHPTQGVVEIKIQNGFELQELHNVSINGSLVDNQVLKYDAPNLLWKNETLVKADVGLDQVDNTSDVNKPVSTATSTALSGKVSKTGDTMTGTLTISPTSGSAAVLQNVEIGQPFGPGYSVISTKLANSDEMYLATSDQTGTTVSKQVVVTSGWTQTANSGAVQVISGVVQTSGNSGNISVASGQVVSGNSGSTIVTSGTVTTSGTTGSAVLRSGSNTGSGASGLARLRSGDSSNNSSGVVEVYTGTSAAASATGYINMFTGAKGSGAANTGLIQLASGSTAGSGTSGGIGLYTGSSTSGNSGSIAIQTGAAGVTRGDISISAKAIYCSATSNTNGLILDSVGTQTFKQVLVQTPDYSNYIHLDMNVSQYPSFWVGGTNNSTNGSNIGSFSSKGQSGGSTTFTGSRVEGTVNGSFTSGTVFVETANRSYYNDTAANLEISTGELVVRTQDAYIKGTGVNANTGNIRLTTGSAAGAGSRGSIIVEAPELNMSNNNITNAAIFYFGDPNTNGTWRIRPSGGSLITEVRQSGIWVVKQTIAP